MFNHDDWQTQMLLKYEKISESPGYITRFQMFFVPLMKFLALLFIDGNRRNIQIQPVDLKDKYNYVIVANHRSMADPFLICYSLSNKIHGKLTPYRFFVVNRMFNYWWLKPWLFSFGCFPARWHHKHKYGLTYAAELIQNGQTIVIFPEGRVAKIDKEYAPKKGVEMLANNNSVRLVPARISWSKRKGLFKRYSLSIGQPFDGKNMTAEQIMDVVYSLKFR